MRNSGFTLFLFGSFGNFETVFIGFKSEFNIELFTLICFFEIDFYEFFADQFGKFDSLFFDFDDTGIIEGIFKDFNSFILFMLLVETFSKS